MANATARRKAEHIRISLRKNVQSRDVTTGFEDVHLIHRALPETNKQEIDLSTTVFGHKFSAPLVVGAMTGGTSEATKINANIAEAVETLGLGMGVGSQRAALEDRRLEKTFSVTRKKAPTAFLIANIGGIQLVNGYSSEKVQRATKMIDANALAVHLNPLQEAVQPEGQTNFKGVLEKIREIAPQLEVPIIAKETGAGIAAEEARKLEAAGAEGIDVSGAGGTSFAAVEYHRSTMRRKASFRNPLGDVFWDWGIPTVASIVEAAQTVKIPVIASGGIRSGVDMVKSLALGARLTSLSHPVLEAAAKGAEETKNTLLLLMEEFKTCMFLAGARSVGDLRTTPLVITGRTVEWLRTRGFDTEGYARRGRD